MNTNHIFANFLERILDEGSEINTRNSITKRLRNLVVTFDSAPLVSARRTAWKSAIREMEWFISGSNNLKDLHPSVHKWWKPWADEYGRIVNNYGQQLRAFSGSNDREQAVWFDQIDFFVNALKDHPNSRRIVGTTWNPCEMSMSETPITNCHGTVIQLFVEPDNTVHMTMYQRSCDMVLGVPHNWIQYWAFLMWLARTCDREVGTFTWVGGDCHIYETHYDIAQEIVDCVACDISDVPNLVYETNDVNKFKAEEFSLDAPYIPLINKSAEMVV